MVSIGHAQTGGGYVPGTAFGGATDPGALKITEGLRIIPTVMVGERYDSNVFFAPKTPGLDREDFVTTTSPQIRGLYAGSLMSVNAVGGGTGEYYAKNTGLNYIGANAGASLDMSKFLAQWWRGSTWQVTESYLNSTRPQSFLTGDVSGASENPFARGYQVGRTRYQTQHCVYKPISSSESDCGLDRQLFIWIHQIWELIGSARRFVGYEFSVLYRRDCDEGYASG